MTTETAMKRQSVKSVLKDVWEWLKSFPRPLPRQKVVIVGDVVHHGEPLQVPPGCCLEIRGNVIGCLDVTSMRLVGPLEKGQAPADVAQYAESHNRDLLQEDARHLPSKMHG